MLTDPRAALADQNEVVVALTGLAGLARVVRGLAAAPRCATDQAADDVVYLLLGVAALGDLADGLADLPSSPPEQPGQTAAERRWLR